MCGVKIEFVGTVVSSDYLIFHIDMDAFFVSVEELLNPRLKGKPVVVGGRSDGRGVVAAASYSARKFGLHAAMPLRRAYHLCPQAIFLPGHPELYRKYSRRVQDVLSDFSPQIKMASIDEAYLNMTGSKRLSGMPLDAANNIHKAVLKKTGLACSIGIGNSHFLAKISSEMAKPNGILWIFPGSEASFLAPLDVEKMPGVGKVARETLHSQGIYKIGQLAQMKESYMESVCGKRGAALVRRAKGHDSGHWFMQPFGVHNTPKSFSRENTFRQDTQDQELLDTTLAELVQLVCRRLRVYKLYGRTIRLKMRYENFKTITRSQTLNEPTNLDGVVLKVVRELFVKNWDRTKAVRLLGVHLGSLEIVPGQFNWFDACRNRKWEKALQAADMVRDRFGELSIGMARAMKNGCKRKIQESSGGGF